MAMEEESAVLFFRLEEEKSTDEELSDKSSTESIIEDKRSSTESDKRSDKSEEERSTDGEERLDKSTGEEDNSMKEEEELDKAEDKRVGAKRKMEFEEDEDDDFGYYDSSDDSDYYYDDEEEDQEDSEQDDLEPVEILNDDGDPVSDETIIMWMDPDRRSPEEKKKLLPKIRRYLLSVYQSEGFECTDFPGVIWGLTQAIPNQVVIDYRDRHIEGYNHLFYMASLAIQEYNRKSGTEFKVLAVERSMYSVSQGRTYSITFTACWGMTNTYQARIWDDTINRKMTVISCEMKPNSPSIPTEKEMEVESSENLLGEKLAKNSNENKKPDVLTIISELNSRSNEQLMELITNTKKDKNMLLKKVRKYFEAIIKSEGFKCCNYPGHIPGLTYLKPRLKIIIQSNNYPECYIHARFMVKLAMDYYFRDQIEGSRVVEKVESINMWKQSSCSYVYYVSFTVTEVHNDSYKELALQAKLQDKQHSIEVIFCRPAR